MKEGKVGFYEVLFFMVVVVITKMFYTSIRVLINATGTAAWYVTIISCTISIIFFLIITILIKRFEDKDIIEIFDAVLGRFFGKIVSLSFSIYFLYYASLNLREFLEMIKAYVFPYTDPSLIIGTFAIVIGILSYLGLETIIRLGYASFYPVILGTIFILVFASNVYDFGYLFPIGGFGIKETVSVSCLRNSAYDEVIILAFIIKSLHGFKNFKRVGVISLIISGIIISVSILCTLVTFQYTQGGENISDLFQLSRIIYYNRFFERVESVFIFIWVLASIVTVTAAFYISLSTYCKSLKINDYKPLILPALFLLFMTALIPKNFSEVVQIHMVVIRQYSFLLLYIVPTIVLMISLIFGKKGEKKSVEKR